MIRTKDAVVGLGVWEAKLNCKDIVDTIRTEGRYKANWNGVWDRGGDVKGVKVVTVNVGNGFEDAVCVSMKDGKMIYIGDYSLENNPTATELFLFYCKDAFYISDKIESDI